MRMERPVIESSGLKRPRPAIAVLPPARVE
jgi:hypothetical protein